MSAVAALCIFAACSKKNSDVLAPEVDPPVPVKVDSSKCLLTGVNYVRDDNQPYFRDPFSLTYDSLRRIVQRQDYSFFNLYRYEPGQVIQRSYVNTIADSNLIQRRIYVIGNDSNIVSYKEVYYNKPKSEDDYWAGDSVIFSYNADGYLVNEKVYGASTFLSQESIFTYQDGNLKQRENIYYQPYSNPVVKRGADTLTYTYDNKSLYPEAAAYLYEVGDIIDLKTGKSNKNNVTEVKLQKYSVAAYGTHEYSTIQYTYVPAGQKLERVNMKATTTKGLNVDTYIGFSYKCN